MATTAELLPNTAALALRVIPITPEIPPFSFSLEYFELISDPDFLTSLFSSYLDTDQIKNTLFNLQYIGPLLSFIWFQMYSVVFNFIIITYGINREGCLNMFRDPTLVGLELIMVLSMMLVPATFLFLAIVLWDDWFDKEYMVCAWKLWSATRNISGKILPYGISKYFDETQDSNIYDNEEY